MPIAHPTQADLLARLGEHVEQKGRRRQPLSALCRRVAESCHDDGTARLSELAQSQWGQDVSRQRLFMGTPNLKYIYTESDLRIYRTVWLILSGCISRALTCSESPTPVHDGLKRRDENTYIHNAISVQRSSGWLRFLSRTCIGFHCSRE